VTETTRAPGRYRWLQVLAEGVALGAVLGIVLGVIWWWVTPPEKWVVSQQGVFPQDPGGDVWFASDGWFLLIGAVGGVAVAAVLYLRHRTDPVATVIACLAGTAVLSLTMWTLGGVLGPDDPNDLIHTVDPGTVLEGSLGVRATAVLLSPTLASLVVLAIALSMTRLLRDDQDASEVPYPAAALPTASTDVWSKPDPS
jgi:hypothetical protein